MKKPDKSKKKFQVRKAILGNRRGKRIVGRKGRIRYRKGRAGDGTGTNHLRQLEVEMPSDEELDPPEDLIENRWPPTTPIVPHVPSTNDDA